MTADDERVVVAVTGASGGAYAKRLVECLSRARMEVHLIVSPWGRKLLEDEAGVTRIDTESLVGATERPLVVHSYRDLGALPASGSFKTRGMIVCPCSSNTLGHVAAGTGDNLITRAAAVTLKEHRRLILVPREMPLSPIDLENMLRLSRAGAVLCPANPGFYMHPRRIEDLVDFVVGKVLDLIGVEHELNIRWKGLRPADEGAEAIQ